ncbi:carbohydrate kinase family protein [Endozoicomonas lisbonensis]|uniref:Sulfofructose kinase n=1 Tax=Endozoicomonas lisbonensis TaxID=3120522 RepID=A0ABV2SE14_9GAMM
MTFDVIVAGRNVIDLFVVLPEEYVQGRKHEVNSVLIQGGAPAANGACGLTSLGLKTAFLGFLGNNIQSDIVRSELVRWGVETGLMLTAPSAAPALAFIEVDPDSGERTVFYSTQNYRPLTPADIKPEWLNNTRLLFIDCYDAEGVIALLQVAREKGIPSVLDMEAGHISHLKTMLALGSHIILPLEAAQFITHEQRAESCLHQLSQMTDAQLVITDGTNGSWASEHGTIIHQPSFEVAVVDTTGCGDAYHAAYAYGLLENFGLAQRMKFASAFAAIVATYLGGRTYFPTPDEVRLFIQSREIELRIPDSCTEPEEAVGEQPRGSCIL